MLEVAAQFWMVIVIHEMKRKEGKKARKERKRKSEKQRVNGKRKERKGGRKPAHNSTYMIYIG